MQVTQERGTVGTEHFDYERRRYNDTVTWLAEVLPGSMRTPFEYQFDGHELYADDDSPLGRIFDDSIEQARNLPSYEQRRRMMEKEEYQEMIAMMRGDRLNAMVVVSDFPPELMDATEDVGGYNVARKQTMLRVLLKTPGGKLQMYSQSLDGSNRRGLEAIYEYFGGNPASGELLGQRIHADVDTTVQPFLIDNLMAVYDRSLQAQYSGYWYAGQLNGRKQNTYDFVCQQQDLLKAYFATTRWFSGGQVDYNLAAAMRARYLSRDISQPITSSGQSHQGLAIAAHAMAIAEMSGAGVIAREQGVAVSGCGATIAADKATDTVSLQDQLADSGYGNKAESVGDDKFGSLQFKCPKGHTNTRPRNKLIEKCQVCKCSVRC